MGYLNKETVTVDAILTKRGRELLARGTSAFNITQFSVADDEIDYGLYNLAHPLGSEFYGAVIENMPVVEASPDETQNLRYKLVSLAKARVQAINVIPTIALNGISKLDLTSGGAKSTEIVPQTSAGQGNFFDVTSGYTAVLNDSAAASIIVVRSIDNRPVNTPNQTGLPGSQTAVGLSFQIRPNSVTSLTQAVVTFYGNESGASISLPITITT